MFLAKRTCLAIFAFIFSLCQTVSGDMIELKNGDRITGTVTSMSAGRVVANTAYANDISIDWGHIKNLQTNKSVILLMKDLSVYQGKVIEKTSDKVVLKTVAGRRLSVEANALDYINPPSYELNKLTYSGDLNLGMYATEGNSHTSSLHIDGELKIRNRLNRYTVGGQFNLQKDQGNDTAKNARAYGDYNRFISNKWYALLNASASRDKFQDLNARVTAGPGMGYQIWQSDLRNLSLESGFNYTFEDFELRKDDEYATFRWSLNLDYWLYKKDVQYFLTHTGLKSIEDTDNLVLNVQTGFKLPVITNLTTKFEFDVDYNDNPAPGTEETDVKYIVSGGYTW